VHDGIDPRNLQAVKTKLFNYFLFTDLLDIGTGILPANVEVRCASGGISRRNSQLRGRRCTTRVLKDPWYCRLVVSAVLRMQHAVLTGLQVNEFVNIAANYETRMEDGPSRMLKLSLSDGRQQVCYLAALSGWQTTSA
jgi:hypothetical protein